MGYRNLQSCIEDLEKCGQLVRLDDPVDAYLEVGSIQRRVYENKGPALLFTNVNGSDFPMVGNLFGTIDRTRYIFKDTLKGIERLVNLKLNPMAWLKNPLAYATSPVDAFHLLPKKVRTGPIMANTTTLDKLPQLVSWKDDGGAFITLPQVYTEHPGQLGIKNSNLGMYRIQISGNEYETDEAGVHYQIHRGMGVHHRAAGKLNQPLKVNVFVGGAPSMTVAAVMPLPEGMPEVAFAGLLGGHRIPMVCGRNQLAMPAEADFCLSGYIMPDLVKPEGPFGDHLGYYSVTHDFPVMKVETVYHRDNAIWPFTTVGRPPQEDTSFGEFIHELTGDLIPDVLPGIKGVHAVDAAGVHPLLLAIGSERYTPYDENKQPKELLTQANAILGQGQLSLAKYVWIADENDNPDLKIHHSDDVIQHILERVDWRRDVHFQTQTTIDTLDYSGSGLNEGSKVIIAAVGKKKRDLMKTLPGDLQLPEGFREPEIALPGILVVKGPKASAARGMESADMFQFCDAFSVNDPINQFQLVVVVDDSEFSARNLNNWLWVTFTRSNPASDIYGIGAKIISKHWGCEGALVIDARIKPHHAPPLIDDPAVEKKVDEMGAKGRVLHGII